jgi:hypothetical protein
MRGHRLLALAAGIVVVIATAFMVGGSSSAGASPLARSEIGHGPTVTPAVLTGDLRTRHHVKAKEKDDFEPEEPDPVSAKFSGTPADAPPSVVSAAAAPLQSFDGLDQAGWGAGWPPDTVGDVGPNHYVQAVNTSFAVFSKTGTRITALTFNTLWSGAGTGTACDSSNDGDPTVVYDPVGDRWIVADFAFANVNTGPYYECIAVSRTSDPVSGGWYLYAVRVDDAAHPWLGDYPKMGIWPDGLYMSANMFDMATGGTYKEVRLWAFNRSDLESGVALRSVVVDLGTTTYFSLLPGNLRGTAPPVGSPEYLVDESQSLFAFDVWKFHVDYSGSGSTLTAPISVGQTSYTVANPTVPSPGNALDSLRERLMMQAQYRNIGGSESLWVNHTVRTSASGPTGIQWAQINVSGGSIQPTPVQQQIFGNVGSDGVHRWMGSLAVDAAGNMALGYSASSAGLNPDIRYSGRLAGDPAGTLPQGESSLLTGVSRGTQVGNCGGSTCVRWGDYSAMSVDPDGCTFWYTTEYYATNGLNWQTRIGSFRLASCGAPAPQLSSFSPTKGAVGTSVVLTGVNLTGASSVKFNGVNAAFTVNSDTQITTTVPAGATTGPIAVTTPAATATSAGSFNVLATLSLQPKSGKAGGTTTVTGSGFHPGTTVTLKWNCANAGCSSTTVLGTPTADSGGAFSVPVTVPAAPAGSYPIGGRDTSGSFAKATFKIALTLAIAPTRGPAGSSATVTGDGYAAGEVVTLLWDCPTASCTSTTVLGVPIADGNGHFSTAVTIPLVGVTVGTSYKIRGKGNTSLGIAYASFKIR